MKYLTLQEVAEKFGVSTKTIGKLAAANKIPCTRATGPLRFPEALLDAWAMDPELVTSKWFHGTIEGETNKPKADNGDEAREEMGRALLLQKRAGQT